MKSNNAPSDWNPTGAAQVSASDSTTLADDLKFALRAMGLREEFVLENGYIKTANLVQYKLPDMSDTPETIVEFVDNYDPAGPLGAKGIGEIPLLSVQPAILNAYFDATGKRVRTLPLQKYM